MFCSNCGSQIGENERFCPECGTPTGVGASAAADPSQVRVPDPARAPDPKRVTLYPDGKYRWTYEMSLFKNPTIFLLIWKIFFFIVLGIFAFITVIDASSWPGEAGARILGDLKIFGIAVAGMTALVGVSYLIYAAIMGGKYVVDFEMDENGIKHAQTPAQARKAKKLGQAAMIAGLASRNFATVGAGISAQRTESYSEFAKVRKVKAYPRRGTIKIRQRLNSNQVYTQNEDFEFVLGFITQRCPLITK